jgi:hypothetical protein
LLGRTTLSHTSQAKTAWHIDHRHHQQHVFLSAHSLFFNKRQPHDHGLVALP